MLVSDSAHIATHLSSSHFQFHRGTMVSADQPTLTSYCWSGAVVLAEIVVGMAAVVAKRVATVAEEAATVADHCEPIGSHRQ